MNPMYSCIVHDTSKYKRYYARQVNPVVELRDLGRKKEEKKNIVIRDMTD